MFNLTIIERRKPNVRHLFQKGRVNYFWREVIRFSQVVLMNIQVSSDITPCRLVKGFKESDLLDSKEEGTTIL